MARSIVVTGASKGIGRATADALADDGWHVFGIARRAPDGFPGEFLDTDLGDPVAVQGLAAALAARGDVLGIVNNAGAARAEVFGEVDPAAFLDLMAFNLRPALMLTQALLPGMRRPASAGSSMSAAW